MNKPIKWSSFAHNDLANLLEYLEAKWNKKSCLLFLNKLDFCVDLIEKNPNLFPFSIKNLVSENVLLQNTIHFFIKFQTPKLIYFVYMIHVKMIKL